MADKTNQIIKAAVDVFIEKGYNATTQDIARKAQVAEVTLFRKFTNKQNLFLTAIQLTIDEYFNMQERQEQTDEPLEKILTLWFTERSQILIINRALVKMLLSESLMGNLPEHMNFPVIFYHQLLKQLKPFEQDVHIEHMARSWVGYFISTVVLGTTSEAIDVEHIFIRPFVKGGCS
ncbi:TetR/AcrR family transcriptional regulator [Halolactibacillus sp. JCM 19043]|uniref:TetR/AcrR family transcriptional regulator n=1 Tax=Halolactibacillus sp. JCM 19043 TaxID=1460638 RepID=UPI0007842ED7|nr:TetR/AcrR family transcriptional regulator [Halolactibacillus sp. JCM 19043]